MSPSTSTRVSEGAGLPARGWSRAAMERVSAVGLGWMGFFGVAAELVPQCRQNAVGKVGLAARAEPGVDGRAQHRRGNALVDRGLNGPAAFAGIGDAAVEVLQQRIFGKRCGR